MHNFSLNGIGLDLCDLQATTAKLWFRVMNFSKQYKYVLMSIFSSRAYNALILRHPKMFIKRYY